MLETQPKWYVPAWEVLGWHIGFWNLIGAFGFTVSIFDHARHPKINIADYRKSSVAPWVLRMATAALNMKPHWQHSGEAGRS